MSGDAARWSESELKAYMDRFNNITPAQAANAAAHLPAEVQAFGKAFEGKSILPRPRKMNAVETAWSQELDRRGVKWRWEAITLRLANDCRYTPDFMVLREMNETGWYRTLFFEVKRAWKGKKRPHIEDDARVKLLVASREYTEFDFWLVWYDGQQWFEERVNG